jgi:putative DNA primase/helicase
MSAADDLGNLVGQTGETEDAPADIVFADATIAELLAAQVFADKFRHATGLGWLQWDGTRWCESADKDARELARAWVAGLFDAAADAWKIAVAGRKDAGQAEAVMRGWKSYLAKTRLDAIVSLASGIHGISTLAGEFDAHPDLLNTQSGVVDLRTGELGKHDPKLLLTKITRAAYVPAATHLDWDQALEAVPDGVRTWYQVRLGQAITGHMTPDDVMLIQQGGGENGKSTLMGAVERALGDYYLTVPHRALLADSRAHNTELTDFRGARFAVLEELPEERFLNVTRLKMLVGTPTMKARKIAQNDMTWDATHSLIVNTNYRPNVNETDHGTWRRLVLVEFPYRFVAKDGELRHDDDRRGDEGLRQRLRQDDGSRGEAVLAWLIEGAAKSYSEDGRTQQMPSLPAEVAETTKAWRAESDVVYQYLTEELVKDTHSHVLAEDLREDLNAWLTSRGHKEWSLRTVAERVGTHDAAREMGMEKAKIRPRAGRSSRPQGWGDADVSGSGNAPSGPRWAWVGVKFADKQASASDQAESGSVPDVPDDPGAPKRNPSRRTVTSTRNIRNIRDNRPESRTVQGVQAHAGGSKRNPSRRTVTSTLHTLHRDGS